MDRNTNKTLLLLHDSASGKNVKAWLNEKGLVAWAAQDVVHAIEEISDFTVANRPDVVMLEVSMLMESYDTLRSAFDPEDGDVKVVAVGNSRGRRRDPFFPDDLDQLKTLISGELSA